MKISMINSQRNNNLSKFYINVFAALLTVTLLLRVYEFVYFTFLFPSQNAVKYELLGLVSDTIVVSFYYLVIISFCFLFIWNTRIYKALVHVFALFIILLSLSTLGFFINAKVLLDHAIFSYSFSEIITTIGASQSGITAYLLIILPILAYYFLFKIFKNKINQKCKLILAILLFISPFLYFFVKPNIENVDNMHNKNLVKNKSDFFINKSIRYIKSDKKSENNIEESTIEEFIKLRTVDGFYRNANPQNIVEDDFKDVFMNQYPLVHINNFNPLDVFFKPIEKAPNVVIISVESAGEMFFNKEVYSESFMPFLDSLKNNSLYWSNCFSTSDRTYNVTPSLLGSLPYGNTGFCDVDPFPNHLSLVSILGNNDYYSSYFYGGWMGFHNMARFHEYQKTNYMKEYFPLTKYRSTAERKKGEFYWGFSDGDMMKRSMDVIDSVNITPMVSFYMTLSTHIPFFIPNEDYYKKSVSKIIDNQKYFSKRILNSKIDIFTAFYYTDRCIAELIEDYKARGLYENTIFIITGDHYSHELGGKERLESYNVPLIIHSPLLNKSAHFEAVVSHLDVAPSIINLLRGRGLIKTPSYFHWLGYGLETNNEPNMKFIPIMQNNKEIAECIWQNYYYSDGKLYTFESSRKVKNIEDENIKKQVINRLEIFGKIGSYTCFEQKVYP